MEYEEKGTGVPRKDGVDGAGGHDRVLGEFHPVHDDGLHADEHAIGNRAAVDDRLVSDRDVGPQSDAAAGVAMQDC